MQDTDHARRSLRFLSKRGSSMSTSRVRPCNVTPTSPSPAARSNSTAAWCGSANGRVAIACSGSGAAATAAAASSLASRLCGTASAASGPSPGCRAAPVRAPVRRNPARLWRRVGPRRRRRGRSQALAGALGVVQGSVDRTRLQSDRTEAMSERITELARDPDPLLRHTTRDEAAPAACSDLARRASA